MDHNTMGRCVRTKAGLGVVTVLAAALTCAQPAAARPGGPAPDSGSRSAPGVSQPAGQWTVRDIAPGVQVRDGVLGHAGSAPTWTVSVQAAGTSRLTGEPTWAEVSTRAWAEAAARKLRTAGFSPRVEDVTWPGYTDTPHGLMGQRVRVGSYGDQAAARKAALALGDAGFHPAVTWTGYDAQQPADRENVHVAVVDPGTFTGTVEGTHDGDVTRRATTSSVATELGSLVAVNGGFFVTADADGVQGTQSGLAVYQGELGAMAAGSRTALILGDGGRRVRVADLTSTVTAHAGASSHAVQGVNRVPGLVRDCGRPGAQPSSRPWQDITCRLGDDLVSFTPAYRAGLPDGPGVQAVLDRSGCVVSVGPRGGHVPADGRVLQGIGDSADWLREHAVPGTRIQTEEVVRDTAGRRIALDGDDSIVSAAPTLVEDGRVSIDAATEGMVDPRDLSFGYAWSNSRQPRTMAGVDARGRLILATVDGRQVGGSEGFTLREAAEFMRSLGAVRAMNLDGGGSTAMAVNGRLVNGPSDATGERAVGDTVQVLPRAAH